MSDQHTVALSNFFRKAKEDSARSGIRSATVVPDSCVSSVEESSTGMLAQLQSRRKVVLKTVRKNVDRYTGLPGTAAALQTMLSASWRLGLDSGPRSHIVAGTADEQPLKPDAVQYRRTAVRMQWAAGFDSGLLAHVRRLKVLVSTLLDPKISRQPKLPCERKKGKQPAATRSRALVLEASFDPREVAHFPAALAPNEKSSAAATAPISSKIADTGGGPVELRLLSTADGEPKGLAGTVVVGVWKATRTAAFVWCSLHYHGLLERSISGDVENVAIDPEPQRPLSCDIDPFVGLHGYALIFEFDTMDGSDSVVFSETWTELHCDHERIPDLVTREGGRYARCEVIALSDEREHRTLGSLANFGGTYDDAEGHNGPRSVLPRLAWSAGAMSGHFPAAVFADVTLRTDDGSVLWCDSQPMPFIAAPLLATDYRYRGEWHQFQIHGTDSEVRAFAYFFATQGIF